MKRSSSALPARQPVTVSPARPAIYGPARRRDPADVLGGGVRVLRLSRPKAAVPKVSLLHVADFAAAIVQAAEALRNCRSSAMRLDDGHPQGYSWTEIRAVPSKPSSGQGTLCVSIRLGPMPAMIGVAGWQNSTGWLGGELSGPLPGQAARNCITIVTG